MSLRQNFFAISRKSRLVLALLFLCFMFENPSVSYGEESDLQVTPTLEGKKDSATKNTSLAKKKGSTIAVQNTKKNTLQVQDTEKRSSFFADNERVSSAKKDDYIIRRNPSGINVKKGKYGLGVTPQIKSGSNQNRGGVFGSFSLEF